MSGTISLLDDILARYHELPPEVQEQVKADALSATSHMLWVPNPGPQTDAYYSGADLLYYGGGAGGGKSQLLTGLAVNEHRVARLFRRQFKDIDGEGGMGPALAQILKMPHVQQKHVWAAPNGAKVEFGAFENEKEASAYQGRAADFFGFDEAVQFHEHLVKFIIGWNRPAAGVDPLQRCRTILASNPPLTPDGLWIFEWFAPWLDDRHPNPAKDGELRWFMEIDGRDTEVERDYVHTIVDGRGNEIQVTPRSRTFIPASVVDNPDLMDAGYANQVAQMPKHLQDALMGKFSASLEDDALQIIPTEWIMRAQARWRTREKEDHGPMTDVGVDVAMSLSDNDGGQATRKNDRFVIAPLHHLFYAEPVVKEGIDIKRPSEGAAAVMGVVRDGPRIKIDMGGGYGAGIAEHLESSGLDVMGMLGAAKSFAMDRDHKYSFANKRAEWIWRFREALDPERGDPICLPPGREVVAELACHRLKRPLGETRIIQVEDKREIIKRLGRSPDIGEALIFAWSEPDREQKNDRASYKRRSRSSRSPPVQSSYATAKAKFRRGR